MCKSMFEIFLGAYEDIFMTDSKEFISYFYKHNKNLSNKLEFLRNYCIYPF